jgi:hypothetical protein
MFRCYTAAALAVGLNLRMMIVSQRCFGRFIES